MEARDRVRSVTANEVLKSQDVKCGSFHFVAVARPGRITVEMATLNSDVRRFLDTFVSTNRAPEKPGSEARGDRRSERQACYYSGERHPKSWVLEVSNDGRQGSWEVVDSRENNEDLNDRHVIRDFAISAPPSGAFRLVRLRLTGKNHMETDRLVISALELFGALSE